MKFLDEFRDPVAATELVSRIRAIATRPWMLMEVCGGQTHGLLRHGIDEELRDIVQLIHGPGCPVCVTPAHAIDQAIQLAQQDGMLVATFGDMLRVPGSEMSLSDARARGATIQTVYSPLDAVLLAQESPDRQVVFFAVGFETTAPATAIALQQARQQGLENFSVLAAHVRVQPAMEKLASDPSNRVQGFLAAGHVCAVVGFESYESFAKQFQMPVVVTGFEPVDLLCGILSCVEQLESGRNDVVNQYGRSVQAHGNPQAIQLLSEVFVVCDQPWRGFGKVSEGGLRLSDAWQEFDAWKRFDRVTYDASTESGDCDGRCRSSEVLSGQIRPDQCEAFGLECTPDAPLGAPMVSEEGACAAYFRYRPGLHQR